jgi:hypothetical protein
VFGGAGERSGGTGSPQATSETGGGMKGGEEKSGDNPQGGKHKNPGMLEIKSCQLSPHYATRKSAITGTTGYSGWNWVSSYSVV